MRLGWAEIPDFPAIFLLTSLGLSFIIKKSTDRSVLLCGGYSSTAPTGRKTEIAKSLTGLAAKYKNQREI